MNGDEQRKKIKEMIIEVRDMKEDPNNQMTQETSQAYGDVILALAKLERNIFADEYY